MRALVVSHLDLAREPNQRTQHMVRMLASHCSEVVVLYSARASGRGPSGLLHDALHPSVQCHQDGVVRHVRVHPWLNYAQALAHGLDDGMAAQDGSPAPPRARRLLADALSSAGALRDLAWLASMHIAAATHAGGRFALALADGPWAGRVALRLRQRGRVARLIYDDMDHVGGGQRLAWRRHWIERLEQCLVRAADVAVCVGPELAALRARTTGRQPLVLPNGADLTRFAPAASDAAPHPPTVLYMGRLEAARGVDMLIGAMAGLRQRLPRARLQVLGDGDPAYVQRLQARIDALDLRTGVQLLGPVAHADLPPYLHQADVGVAAFRLTEQGRYAVPLKVAEYMACGLPVVCTAGSAAAHWVERLGAGVGAAFSEPALADALAALLTDLPRRQAAAAAGRAAAQQLAWPRITAQMWQLMQPAGAGTA